MQHEGIYNNSVDYTGDSAFFIIAFLYTHQVFIMSVEVATIIADAISNGLLSLGLCIWGGLAVNGFFK